MTNLVTLNFTFFLSRSAESQMVYMIWYDSLYIHKEESKLAMNNKMKLSQAIFNYKNADCYPSSFSGIFQKNKVYYKNCD